MLIVLRRSHHIRPSILRQARLRAAQAREETTLRIAEARSTALLDSQLKGREQPRRVVLDWVI